MVSLHVHRNVAEDGWIAIDVEGLDGAREVLASLVGELDLARKVSGEVGGCLIPCQLMICM